MSYTPMDTENYMNFSGIASLSDLKSRKWIELFSEMEKMQDEFLGKDHLFRSDDYKWPRDALHNWSRIWEYPWTYHQLHEFKAKFKSDQNPKIADIGSGVTFFPFEVARLGFYLTCVDVDPVVERDLLAASKIISPGSGTIAVELTNGNELPFANNSLDAVYSVSVIEHIPDFKKTIDEIYRVLKPNGLFGLTFDLDLRGDSEIGINKYKELIGQINSGFDELLGKRIAHPADFLTSRNSPERMPGPPALAVTKYAVKRVLKSIMNVGDPVLGPPHLAVYSGSYIRKP
ncbi:MAG: class I SAM-dependent methyltransferase [Hyphomicrobiales bacterium]|nr:class I SAM-dependent methyltransferase [Hyphomicrobiales bacterium]